ncbi:MAG TPA: HEAT repeat domain-containing protein [Nannocystaceae bacterium]|nr:HEAT repeat domain-containing protein [Nannocystaceae bacterium]
MTLAAALRDATHAVHAVRVAGVRNLAPALLAELRRPGPILCNDDDHPSMPAVRERLVAALDDALPEVQGHAVIGLALLGRDELVEHASKWLALERDDEPSRWLRETAVIALGHLGVAAGDRPALLGRVRTLVRKAWASPHDDTRFQAALALVDVDDPQAEELLADALAKETHADLREQIVVALSHLPRVSSKTCDRLARVLAEGDEARATIGFEIALVLAAHQRHEAGARLVLALRWRAERDRALEALAALGASAPAEAIAGAARLAGRPWVPSITRVRAAYALVRMAPAGSRAHDRAERYLRRWAWHPRPAVREAVADVQKARASLDAEGEPRP